MTDSTQSPGGEGPTDALSRALKRGKPRPSLDEHIALTSLETALFDRSPRPLTVSRYVLSERLGQGASGLVYRAYDPELDRRVAVKLLQARADKRGDGADRLLAEAQALARLAHPNVVSVYDVGSYSELDLGGSELRGAEASTQEIPSRGVFIVMELVEGRSLDAWMVDKPRTAAGWREVVGLFIAAGRGLAAAHASGLVHRDFKPANVQIGSDGRARVLDFGLATAADRSRDSERREIAGTLAYMAPEQHRGLPADTRSDQFAFGVSLYHALVGELPFQGRGPTLVAKKHAGPEAALDRLTRGKIPRHVRGVLARALAVDPAGRFPSMDALLAALVDDATRRRRRRAGAVGGTLLLGGLFAVLVPVMAATLDEDPCAGADAAMRTVWSDDRRQAVDDAVASLDLPFANDEWQRVERGLDAYAAEWSRSRRATCEASHVRGEQSVELTDRRVACLDRRRRAFERVVVELSRVDAEALEHAWVGVRSLPDVATCSDIDALLRGIDPPRVELRGAVDEAYAELARVRASLAEAHFVEARALAREVVQSAARIDYAPLLADAELAFAEVLEAGGEFEGAERHLVSAVLAAERGRDDASAADAWLRLLWVVGVERGELDEGETWSRFASAAVERLGGDRLREAQLAHDLGGLRYAQGRYDEALASYQQALEIQRDMLGPGHPTVARTLNHIGNVLIMLRDYDRAFELCAEAGELRRLALGDGHPLVAATLNNRAVIRIEQGRLDEARDLLDRARAIVADTGTPEALVTFTLTGDLAVMRGETEAARAAFGRARELARSIHGPEHFLVRSMQENLDRITPSGAMEKRGETP